MMMVSLVTVLVKASPFVGVTNQDGVSSVKSFTHPLYIPGNTIAWNVFEDAFKKYYSATQGQPAKPIRLIVSLLILYLLQQMVKNNK